MSTVTVAALLPYVRELVFVTRAASISKVRSVMTLNEISRVPVIENNGRKLQGIVRLKTLFRLGVPGMEPPPLRDVMDASPPVVAIDAPLFEAIGMLRNAKEVLVQHASGQHTHMLTSTTVARWLADYSKPFLVIEELETALRECLWRFEGDRLEERTKHRRVHELNPADYALLCVELREAAPTLSEVEIEDLREVLVRFAEARNRLMHFRLEDPRALDPQLERFLKLRRLLSNSARTSVVGAMATLDRAIAIATEAHAGQLDKAGAPYILHPLRVMLAQATVEARIVGVLHDVCEDRPEEWSLERLRSEGFSEEVLAALASVTRQKGEEYDDFVLRAAANPIGRAVKLADMRDNADLGRIADPTEADRTRVAKYLRSIEAIEGLERA